MVQDIATTTNQQLLERAQQAAEAARQAADAAQTYADQISQAAGVAAHAASNGQIDPFVFRFAIFALACGFFAVILASVNIFGGFLVTERMLGMYKAKKG